MNYEKQYTNLCQSRQQRILSENVYYETHHIQPRCMGGSDEPSNLVKLTPREHYIAHLLLWKAHPRNVKLFWPLQWFYNKDGTRIPSRIIQHIKQNRNNYIGLRDYSWMKKDEYRIKKSKITSGQNKSFAYRQEVEYKETQSNKMKKQQRHAITEKDTKSGRFNSTTVKVDGHTYPSLTAAAKANGISVKAAYNRRKSHLWPQWE